MKNKIDAVLVIGCSIFGFAIGFVIWAMFFETNGQCKQAYYQMQSTMRCIEAYPRCSVTPQDYLESRNNLDYYDRNCYEYEQRRPKQPKAEKQSFKI